MIGPVPTVLLAFASVGTSGLRAVLLAAAKNASGFVPAGIVAVHMNYMSLWPFTESFLRNACWAISDSGIPRLC